MIALEIESHYAEVVKKKQVESGGDRKSESYEKSVVVKLLQLIKKYLEPTKPKIKEETVEPFVEFRETLNCDKFVTVDFN